MEENNSFLKGVAAGMPICLGYLSVAFAFGIFAVGNGLTMWQALFMSMANVTSAGQLAAVPIIASGGTVFELALSQVVINMRYALMSVSLSQKVSDNVRPIDRFIISFMNTDEVFGVASGCRGSVGRNYLYGLILTPYIGWSLGTLIGAAAGDILPSSVTSALGIAIYAMFAGNCHSTGQKAQADAFVYFICRCVKPCVLLYSGAREDSFGILGHHLCGGGKCAFCTPLPG